jgi:hypothetical protein
VRGAERTASGVPHAIAETLGNLTTLSVKDGNTTFMLCVYGVNDLAQALTIEQPMARPPSLRSRKRESQEKL